MSPDLSAPPPPVATPAPHSLILLVEDDRLSQRLVAKVFAGHEVLVAETATEAMDLLRRHPHVDLTVVDYQLRGENGSSFVAELRRHSFGQDLPVVAYTGSRDREVVMRYAELRAQAFHVKPYRAETLLNELVRAHATGRRERQFESAESACRRMKLKPEEYAGLLNSGAALLEQDIQGVRRLLLAANDPRLAALFRDIAHRMPQLGVRIVAPLAQQAQRELNQGDYHACTQTLVVLDAVAALIRRRALEILSLGASVVDPAAPADPRSPARPEPACEDGALPPRLRPILAQPLGLLGAHAAAAARGAILRDGKLADFAAGWWSAPACDSWIDAIRQLDRLEDASIETATARLAALPGFAPTLHHILVRSELARTHELAGLRPETIAEKFGVAKTTILAIAALLARTPAKSPLSLQDFRTHAIAAMLLGFELGRFLRVTHPQRVAGAAISRDLGFWILANASPVSAALLLARAAHLSSLEQAETEILGGRLRLAAVAWSRAAGLPALYADSAADSDTPEDSRVTLLIVRLAESIVAPLLGGPPEIIATLRAELARPDHATWSGLERLGIKPPVDLGEAADLVLTLARSAAWTAGEIVHPR